MAARRTGLRRTTGRLKAANVKQLEVIMQAGIAAAQTGSQDPSNLKRRVTVAIRRKARELGVATPDLTGRVKAHMERLARGYADLMPDVSVSNEKLARAEALEQLSDFADAPRLSEAERKKYKAMEDELPPKVSAAAANKRNRKPACKALRDNAPPPPVGAAGPKRSAGTESERRVHEIVRRMGLGATRRQIHDWARQSWESGISERNIDEYIQAARAILRTNWHRDREDFMVDLLEQYQVLAADARLNDQLNTALGCLNSMAKLANMGGFANGQVQ